MRCFVTILLLVCCRSASAWEQDQSYAVTIKVLIQPIPQHHLEASSWGPVFEKLGQRATFTKGQTGDRVSLYETETRGRKGVLVVGMLNRDGSIRFPDKTVRKTDTAAMKAWLDRLRKFGARGPANESATWGLTEVDFKDVLQLLSGAVKTPVNLQTVTTAIDSLELPSVFKVTFTEEARRLANRQVRQIGGITPDCTSLSKGSALAVVLAQFGLGFRPQKDRNGQLLLQVDVGDEDDNLYPIGWKNTRPITMVVRNLTKRFAVSLDEQNVNLVIQLLAQKLELPYAYAAEDLLQEGIDPDQLTYSRQGKASAYTLIESLERQYGLGISFRTDEHDQVFLWVTTRDNKKAFNVRFKHVKQKF